MRVRNILIIVGFIFCFSFSDVLEDYTTARRLYRKGNNKESFQLFKTISRQPSEVRDFALYYLGQLSSIKDSIPIYEELLRLYPNFVLSSTLQTAIRDYYISIDKWDKFSTEELWEIANQYHNKNRWSDSQKIYTYLIRKYPTTTRKAEALYYLGVNSLKLGEFATANVYFSEVISSDNKTYPLLAKYFQSQVILARDGSSSGIIALGELRNEYQEDRKMMEKLLPEMARVYRVLNRYQEAEECYKTFLQLFPTHNSSDEIRFNLARMYYVSGNYEPAKEYFQKIASKEPLSQSYGAVSLYMLTLIPGSDPVQNQIIYERIYNEYPWSYYGHLSASRIGKTFRRESVDFSSTIDIHKLNPRIKLFMEIEDYETASILLRPEFFKNRFNPQLALFLIKLYEKSNDYYRAIIISELIWSEYEKRGKLREMPVVFWEKCFPRYYWEEISKESGKYGIDPYMILSLIRQESHFNKNALSRSKAIGLMQIKKSTADGLAKGMGFGQFNLNDPLTNIMLGTRFYAIMDKRYPSYPHYSLASYNAGPNAAKKWIIPGKNLSPEEFAETIDYTETRNYVKIVMRNYWNYKELYQWANDTEL